MPGFIIGNISNMHRPLSPFREGETALSYYLTQTSEKEVQDIRDAVLSTTTEDIREMADFVEKILEQSALCVYGNEDKIKSEKQLFKETFTL